MRLYPTDVTGTPITTAAEVQAGAGARVGASAAVAVLFIVVATIKHILRDDPGLCPGTADHRRQSPGKSDIVSDTHRLLKILDATNDLPDTGVGTHLRPWGPEIPVRVSETYRDHQGRTREKAREGVILDPHSTTHELAVGAGWAKQGMLGLPGRGALAPSARDWH